MYFIVKYIEFPKFNRQSEPVSKTPSQENISTNTFEKVKEKSLTAIKTSKRNIRNSVVYETSIEASDLTAPIIDDENKEVLVNPDCFLGSIIDYIREVAVIPKAKNFKMCTTEGELTEFSNVLSTSGLEYFEPKQTYLIFLQEFDIVEGTERRIPLLDKTSELYSILLLKLKQVPSLPEIEPKKNISKTNAKSKERLRSRRASRKEVKSGGLSSNK